MTIRNALALPPMLALVLTLAAAPALADPAFDTAEGTWSGKGWVKRDTGDDKQAVRCRISTNFTSPRLSIDGKCAASGTNFMVKAYIDETARGFTGRWYNPFGADTAAITGRKKGDTVDLTFAFPNKEGKGTRAGRLLWKLGADQLVLTSAGRKGEELSRIEFAR